MLFIIDEPTLHPSKMAADRRQFIDTALEAVANMERALNGHETATPSVDIRWVLRLATFAADLLACAQLWQWERAGVVDYLSGYLPTFDDVIVDFKHRIEHEPERFLHEGPSQSQLFDLVAGVRARSFRFSPHLATELLIAEVDEETLVEALAQMAFGLLRDGASSHTGIQVS